MTRSVHPGGANGTHTSTAAHAAAKTKRLTVPREAQQFRDCKRPWHQRRQTDGCGLSLAKFSQATDLKKRLWFTHHRFGGVPLPLLRAAAGRRSDGPCPALQADAGRHSRHLQHLLGRFAPAHEPHRAWHHPISRRPSSFSSPPSLSPQLEALKKKARAGARSSTNIRVTVPSPLLPSRAISLPWAWKITARNRASRPWWRRGPVPCRRGDLADRAVPCS